MKTGAMLKMSKHITQLNKQRRRVVQGAVLTSAAMAAPGLANAICASGDHKLAISNEGTTLSPMLTGEDVSIELVETASTVRNGMLARVSVHNKSTQPIKLRHISPGAVSTQRGVYQINATLSQNPLAIQPGGTYQFWLTPDDGTQALQSRKPNFAVREASRSATLEVSVRTELDSGPWSGIQRVHALMT